MKKLLADLKVSFKLRLVTATFSVPFLTAMGMLVAASMGAIRSTNLERDGVRYLRPVMQAEEAVSRHERLLWLDPSQVPACTAEVDKALSDLEEVQAQLGSRLEVTELGLAQRKRVDCAPEKIRSAWMKLKGVEASDAAVQGHAELLAALGGLVAQVGDSSGLVLDPDLDSYYLMDVAVVAIPQSLVHVTGLLRATVAVRDGESPSRDQVVDWMSRRALLEDSDFRRGFEGIDSAINEDPNFHGPRPGMAERLQSAVGVSRTALGQFSELLRRGTDVPSSSRQRAALGVAAGEFEVSLGKLWSTTAEELDGLLSTRCSELVGTLWKQVVSALFALLLAWFVVRAIQNDILQAVYGQRRFVASVAGGDLAAKVPESRKDELGDISRELRGLSLTLVEIFSELSRSSKLMGERASSLGQVSSQLTESSSESSSQAGHLASASEQVSKGVGTVATAVEELSCSVSELSRQASEAGAITSEASRLANSANGTIDRLNHSSAEIDKVVALISGLAGRINLLALNATIEAARAGEAGKGFAVVAGEVKELSVATAKATGEISTQVREIKTTAGEAIVALQRIGEIIGRINGYQLTLASSFEEQTATTQAIARNTAEIAEASTEIARSAQGVSALTRKSDAASATTTTASAELGEISEKLGTQVGRFRLP